MRDTVYNNINKYQLTLL